MFSKISGLENQQLLKNRIINFNKGMEFLNLIILDKENGI